ncbi:hypothetical protein [Nocardioides sp.]|uniref:hypothetical protein n=1 Tax=Nocardioides sp. TaxID=35761 RepID=UPI0027250D7D|nr:hypothetical protein [Nocardioides sp.]MDO9455377.1 hypothetical protein [Nocardioides sp.]
MRLRLLRPCSCLLVVAVIAGCGDDDGNEDAGNSTRFREGFEAAVDRAHADGVDQGGGTTSCFVLDDEAVHRVSAALGLAPSATLDDSAYLSGGEGTESLQCSYVISSEDEAPPTGIVVASTDQDLEEYVDGILGRDDPPEQLDGNSAGLDDASVTGFARDGFQQAVWVQDGVRVQLGAREQDVDAGALFEALPVLVDEVDRVLGTH